MTLLVLVGKGVGECEGTIIPPGLLSVSLMFRFKSGQFHAPSPSQVWLT